LFGCELLSADEKATFQLEILTPEREVFNAPVSCAILTGTSGVFELLPRHEPLLCPLGVGLLGVQKPDASTEVLYAVHGGFLEVSGNKATVLADSAEHGDEVDLERARGAMQRAKERLTAHTDAADELNRDRARLALMRSVARIDAMEKGIFI